MRYRVFERRRDARRAGYAVGLRAVAVRLEEADRRRDVYFALSHSLEIRIQRARTLIAE